MCVRETVINGTEKKQKAFSSPQLSSSLSPPPTLKKTSEAERERETEKVQGCVFFSSEHTPISTLILERGARTAARADIIIVILVHDNNPGK